MNRIFTLPVKEYYYICKYISPHVLRLRRKVSAQSAGGSGSGAIIRSREGPAWTGRLYTIAGI